MKRILSLLLGAALFFGIAPQMWGELAGAFAAVPAVQAAATASKPENADVSVSSAYDPNPDKMIRLESSQNKFTEISVSKAEYTFQEGDTIEYQVYLNQRSAEIGGIDIYFEGAIAGGTNYIRDEKEFVDEYGVEGHPGRDISNYAYRRWYTRRLRVPQSAVGATTADWCVAIGSRADVSGNTVVYYDNIVVRDKNGNIVCSVFTNAADESGFETIVDGGDTSLKCTIATRRQGDEAGIQVLEGGFGKIEIDTVNPSIIDLWLRQPNGTLSEKSLLAKRFQPRVSAYSYLVDESHVYYDSRLSKSHTVEIMPGNDGMLGVRLKGVRLLAEDGTAAPVSQNWTIAVEDGKLRWEIEQEWSGGFSAILAGMPALYLADFGGWGTTSPREQAQITSTLWYDPSRIRSEYSFDYENLYNMGEAPDTFMSDDVCLTVMDRDAFAIIKLYTTIDLKSDIGMQAEGGYLYRRGGSSVAQSEIGLSLEDGMGFERSAGDKDSTALVLYPADASATGMQLNFDLPESEQKYENFAKYFYGALLNGGVVSNNKEFYFGNSSEGCNYGGNVVWHGFNLLAGIEAEGQISSEPYRFTEAFKRYLTAILATKLPDSGLTVFGYNGVAGTAGTFTDDNLDAVIACGMYYLSTGDSDFLKQIYPRLTEIMEYFRNNMQQEGQFEGLYKSSLGRDGWYYDAMLYTGFNCYMNVLLYKAFDTLSEIADIAGDVAASAAYAADAVTVKDAINRVFWNETPSVGGPRYSDWIEDDGTRHEYFVDLCQYNAIVHGVASPEQAKKIVATADARIAELVAEDGYTENASLSNLWPIPSEINQFAWGEYMNGGSFFSQTFFEIVARCMAGDADGAYYRFKKFEELYEKTKFYGTNGCNMQGEIVIGGEAYLADVVTVMSSVMFGFIGIRPDFDGLKIEPSIPSSWGNEAVSAQVRYLGAKYEITIENGEAQIAKEGVLLDTQNIWRQEMYPSESGTLAQDGLIALFNFEETYQQYAVNSVDPMNPGKYVHAVGYGNAQCFPPVTGQPGKYGMSHYFGEVSGAANQEKIKVVKSYDFGETQSFTLAGWFKVDADAIDSNPIIFGKVRNGLARGYFITMLNRQISAVAQDDLGNQRVLIGGPRLEAERWYHVAAVYDRAQNGFVLYLDGEEVARGDISTFGGFTEAEMFFIGSGQYGVGLFNGYLDDVAIFNKALTQQQIKEDVMPGLTQSGFRHAESGELVFDHVWPSERTANEFVCTVRLNGGTVDAVLEVLDGEGQVADTVELGRLKEGENEIAVPQVKAGKGARVRFTLATPDSTKTPRIENFTVTTAEYSAADESVSATEPVVYEFEDYVPSMNALADTGAFEADAEIVQGGILPFRMTWNGVRNAYAYRVVISTDRAGSNVVFAGDTEQNELITLSLPQYTGTLYAHISAYTPYGLAESSSPVEFTLQDAGIPMRVEKGAQIKLPTLALPAGYECRVIVRGPNGMLTYGDFTAQENGEYTIEYTLLNSGKQISQTTFTVTAADGTNTSEPDEGGCSAGIGAVGCAVFTGTAAVVALAFIKKKKEKE